MQLSVRAKIIGISGSLLAALAITAGIGVWEVEAGSGPKPHRLATVAPSANGRGIELDLGAPPSDDDQLFETY